MLSTGISKHHIFLKLINIGLQQKKKQPVFNLAHMQKTLSQFSSVPTLQLWIAVKFNSTDLAGCTSPPCNLSRALQGVLRENNVDHLTRHSQHKGVGHWSF